MKIGILTLPLTNNYGGHLQAWALQTVLERERYDTILLDIRRSDEKKYYIGLPLKSFLAYFIKYLPGKSNYHYFDYRKLQELNFRKFREKYFKKTSKIYGSKQLKRNANNLRLEALVVGSDQVWRKWEMVPLDFYFLSWLKPNIKCLGYAISYGKSIWTLSEQETVAYAEAAKRFIGLSMREKDGVKLTKQHFGLDSELVLDPTMLLDKSDYLELCGMDCLDRKMGLFYYVLDQTKEKKDIISTCSEALGAHAFEVMPKARWFDPMKNCPKEDYVYPSVQEWISAFATSSFVVTDSFHGTVFAIIFNKPFIVLGNDYRGLSRIHSLLSMFGLEKRLVVNGDDVMTKDILNSSIDWELVNRTRERWKCVSLEFLRRYLDK